jgi:tRNA nucleotidyltransferase/poly(A) polymerase
MTIPVELSSQIPEAEKRALSFILEYLRWKDVPVDGVYINGGFVRDLLLGKSPDDLDISLCLIECEQGTTIQSLLQDIPSYIAHLTAEVVLEKYRVKGFKSLCIQGDNAKNKNIDTAKAIFEMVGHDADPTLLQSSKASLSEGGAVPPSSG